MIINNVLITSSDQPRLRELIKRLQLAIHHHQSKNGHSLTPVENMIAFTEEHAPELFGAIIDSITHDKTSDDRYNLQEKRACAILRSLVYYG